MPDFCAAFGCCNERNAKTKEQGITFHRFPKDKVKRRAWAAALRRRNFVPNDRSVVCSCHFKSEDFDRTGQTTRLREGVIPSVFTFSVTRHLSKAPCNLRTSRTSQKAAGEIPDVHIQPSKDLHQATSDHQYALDPDKVKHKLTEAKERLEELQRDLRNAKDRERRHKKVVETLLDNLKCRNMLTKELQQELDFHSGEHHGSCCSAAMERQTTVKKCKQQSGFARTQQAQKKAHKDPHCENEDVSSATEMEKD